MSPSATQLRVGVVQFAPQIGRVAQNIDRAREICLRLQPDSLDLLCLPEMIFSVPNQPREGYVFSDADAITPYLEEPRTGPTSRFCAELAVRLRCYVMAGYPERLAPHEVQKCTTPEGEAVHQVGANSAVVYGPDGQCIAGYRKTNLFSIDKPWAKPGTGFLTLDLPSPLNRVTLAICNDLNPDGPWTLDGPYEVADHCIATKTNLLVLLNAWLDSGADDDSDEDWETLHYWAMRLRPLYIKDEKHHPPNQKADAAGGGRIITVICNRCGEENGKTFAGTSSVFDMRQDRGKPLLHSAMGRLQEDVQIWKV
ncbi:hypothetical protein EWM64_g813 [Hericium alpestre]|uniref:CN hydrolase domain-containing protein n=1 Tax=Hericium alpestre TaxID=135208 RepID=A0A4Z0AAB4_9AGAM|nr:hypothetical protein EWM64_g813 [Hericium alpestre]